MTTGVVVVPSAPALLASYAGITDPVAELRAASLEAVAWLVARSRRIVILGAAVDPVNLARGVVDPLSLRVGRSLLAGDVAVVESEQPGPLPDLRDGDGLLVVADGSARRGEKAPGHIDERSFAFDASIEQALTSGDTAALAALDAGLGAELLVGGVPALRALGARVGAAGRVESAQIDYAADPFGVQYWVVRWTCGS